MRNRQGTPWRQLRSAGSAAVTALVHVPWANDGGLVAGMHALRATPMECASPTGQDRVEGCGAVLWYVLAYGLHTGVAHSTQLQRPAVHPKLSIRLPPHPACPAPHASTHVHTLNPSLSAVGAGRCPCQTLQMLHTCPQMLTLLTFPSIRAEGSVTLALSPPNTWSGQRSPLSCCCTFCFTLSPAPPLPLPAVGAGRRSSHP